MAHTTCAALHNAPSERATRTTGGGLPSAPRPRHAPAGCRARSNASRGGVESGEWRAAFGCGTRSTWAGTACQSSTWPFAPRTQGVALQSASDWPVALCAPNQSFPHPGWLPRAFRGAPAGGSGDISA
eukprot:scaffold1182_cov396-Prasinococcus_capsulatus_cf.AAC.19